MTALVVTDLTQATLAGTGVFDALMRATKVHLDAEFAKNRIKGPEYSTVYLGSLEASMQTALAFLAQRQKIPLEATLMQAQIDLVLQQTANAVLEGTVLLATECKLRAEYDLLILQKARTSAETALLVQKMATEKAQTTSLGVDADSILGRQKNLYLAQTDGFARDAEQKAAKLLADTWNVRRTTDEGTIADATNMLNDATVGRAITKMLTGVGA